MTGPTLPWLKHVIFIWKIHHKFCYKVWKSHPQWHYFSVTLGGVRPIYTFNKCFIVILVQLSQFLPTSPSWSMLPREVTIRGGACTLCWKKVENGRVMSQRWWDWNKGNIEFKLSDLESDKIMTYLDDSRKF